MRRVWLVVGIAGALVGASAPEAGRAAVSSDVAVPRAGSITAVSLHSADGRAEMVIGVLGEVEVQDFALEAPHRIVLDFSPATLKMASQLYDGVARGGVTSVRVAYYRPNVVRVVLDLDKAREYDITRGDGDVRVVLNTPVEAFEPWVAGAPQSVPQTAPKSASQTAPQAAVKTPPAVQQVPPQTAQARQTVPARATSTPVAPQAQAGPRISVTFRDTDIRDVLAVFSELSGRSIVTGLGATPITAEIVDQPWQTALVAILSAYGLAVVDDPQTGILRVATLAELRAEQAAEPVNTVRLPLNHAKAIELQATLEQLLSTDCAVAAIPLIGAAPGAGAAGAAGAGATPPAAQTSAQPALTQACNPRGKVVAEAPTNTLIISEVASRIDSLVAYARSFDLRPQQVNIKVQVISINRTNTQTLGISYDIGTPQTFFNTLAPRTGDDAAAAGEFQVTLGGDAFAGVANAGRPHAAGAAINLLYNTTIGNFSLTSFLDALTQDELADVHASPSVNILDKKLSRLFVGASTSYLLTPQTAAGAIQSQPPIVSTLETGITLEVTPSISANRTIRLTVSAEQSTLVAITVAGPNASKRQVSGEVVVNDGETMVIAGLTQSQVTKTRSGIPLLMNLPVLGRLFSQNRSEDRQDDLLILITPHILDDPIPGAARR